MKSIVCEKYGLPEVLKLKEVDKPTPKNNEVLIKTYATTVTSADWRVRSLNVPVGFGFMTRLLPGVSRPRQPILGTKLAGVVESVGNDVSKFKIGDLDFFRSGKPLAVAMIQLMLMAPLMLMALLMFAAPAFAQPVQPNLSFQHVTVQDGLSQNAVQALVQDRNGFLWIATEDGLNRYDGYSFSIYGRQRAGAARPDSSSQGVDAHRVEHLGLSDALLHSLYEDSNGSLWIGTSDGVNRYVRPSGKFRHYRPWSEELGVHTPLSVRAITQDLQGRLWVGATPGGLSQLDADTGSFQPHL